MTNSELREAVKIYRNVKKKLDDLQSAYLRSSFQIKVVTLLDPIIREKYKSSVIHRQEIEEKLHYPEQDKATAEEQETYKTLQSHEIKLEIEYLELKLNVIKGLLDNDVIKKLESNERETILK